MNKPTVSLDLVQVASPCHVPWNEMTGDERVRFCGQCKLKVYDLSEMSRSEAEALIQAREGRTCVRFYRRPDGTVLTRDCPVGLRAVRQRFVRAVTALAGILLALVTGTLFAGRLKRSHPDAFRYESPVFSRWIQPQPEHVYFLGDIAVPISPTLTPAPGASGAQPSTQEPAP